MTLSPSINKSYSTLAVIGGGRWARVILSELAKIDELPFDTIVMVSKFNNDLVRKTIDEISIVDKSVAMVSTINELLNQYSVQSAIIANAAHQHFDSAAMLIEHGAHLLIEKPIVLTSDHMKILLDKALAEGISLTPGLLYRFCSYIKHFAQIVLEKNILPCSFLVEWQDASREMRYGETKKYDASIDVAEDVMSHIWTILSIIFPGAQMYLEACLDADRRRLAEFSAVVKIDMKKIDGRIFLERDARERRRRVTVQYNNGEEYVLEFTIEPGKIYFISPHENSSKSISGDPDWEKSKKPLARQFQYFLSNIKQGITTKEDSISALSSVIFTEKASSLIKEFCSQ
jgi:predicted dehydrogenase